MADRKQFPWVDWNDKPNPYDLNSSAEERKKYRRDWVDWNDKPNAYDLSQREDRRKARGEE